MTAEPDLLPCPWCGEKLKQAVVLEGSTFRWRRVAGCCADGPEVRHDTMADDQSAAEVESTAAAIAAWNTRATAARDAEVEALRARVERAEAEARDYGDQRDEAIGRAERLAEALRERRDWFEAQAKSISKGNGSSWDLMQVREQRDLCDAALDQEAGRG